MNKMLVNMVKANIETAKDMLKQKNLSKKDKYYLNKVISRGKDFLEVVEHGRDTKTRRVVGKDKG